ncbi:MAG: complex I subunit 1 family protein [Syntrophaceae bacterium]
MKTIAIGIAYVILAPVIGGLLVGLDRIISARMQRRVGPPILQPFYDIFKLLQKKTVVVNRLQNPAIFCHLFFMIATGFLFFEGSDILLIIFVLTLSGVFLVLAASASGSPFSHIGAERELILMTAYEPMVLMMLVGIYKVTDSFHFYAILESAKPLIVYLPGIFVGFLYILTMKLRKSPFDISYSHHAHQELVKGIMSDMSGKSIAMVEIAHWYENVFLLGLVYLFFGFSPVLGIAAVILTYVFEILVDNTFARFRWELAFRSAWLVALVLGGGNLIALYALMGGA